jgi:hypothetical protein
MKELTNKQKLNVLEEIQRDYDGEHLCSAIAKTALNMGHINGYEYVHSKHAKIARNLIPDLLQFRPNGMDENASWFGPTDRPESIAKRTQVLKDLIEVISQKESDYN